MEREVKRLEGWRGKQSILPEEDPDPLHFEVETLLYFTL